MKLSGQILRAAAMIGACALVGTAATAQQPATKAGAACGATSSTATPDNAVEPKSGRTFVLQYPCDLQPGEDVTLILNIHGAGSSSSYQHRYFPAGDLADEYRLVVATPTAAAPPPRTWQAANDDQYLADLTELMFAEFGRENIKSFWLAGHSQGGATSQRIVCSDYFAGKVDGFLSLSGGRLGGSAGRNPNYNATEPGGPVPEPTAAAAGPARGGARGGGQPSADGPTTCDYSNITAYGEWEIAEFPQSSSVADRFACQPRARRADIVDAEAGYVWDPSRQNPTRIGWGRRPAPGTAQMWVFEGCRDGRLVADVVRLDKGHTEGLEPNVTEEIVKLMTSAAGGKARGG